MSEYQQHLYAMERHHSAFLIIHNDLIAHHPYGLSIEQQHKRGKINHVLKDFNLYSNIHRYYKCKTSITKRHTWHTEHVYTSIAAILYKSSWSLVIAALSGLSFSWATGSCNIHKSRVLLPILCMACKNMRYNIHKPTYMHIYIHYSITCNAFQTNKYMKWQTGNKNRFLQNQKSHDFGYNDPLKNEEESINDHWCLNLFTNPTTTINLLTVDNDVKFLLYSSSAVADPLDALIAWVALPITINFGRLLLRCR